MAPIDRNNEIEEEYTTIDSSNIKSSSASEISKEAEELLEFINAVFISSRFPEIPLSLSQNEKFATALDYITMLRDVLSRFSRGDIAFRVTHRGFIAGCLKELQGHLRHLTWYADRLATGDFGQRIDFMGNFADSFNAMSERLYNALNALKESEASLRNITEELHLSEERWKLAVACTQDGIWDIDLKEKKAFFSHRLWEILRRPAQNTDVEFSPHFWSKYIHPDDVYEWADIMKSLEVRNPDMSGRRYFEFRVRGGDGKYRWVGSCYMLLCDNNGFPYRFVGACEDIQERREREDAIRLRATHDNLTGLPNRYLYNDRLIQQMVMSKRTDTSLVLIVWDLDGFKEINDTYGHLAGDQLLKGAADAMQSCMRETDTLARFGGDEFVMLLACSLGYETEVAVQTTTRIFEILKTPINIGETSVVIDASCGISFFPKHATDGDKLFLLADKALYMAKRLGKNRVQVWIPEYSEEDG